MVTYYRYTDSLNPMSDWGHAMFSDNQGKVINYGSNGFTLDESQCISIYDLEGAIVSAWEEYQKEWAEYDEFAQFDAQYIFDSLNPCNIVESADGYDHDLTLTWFWDFILSPMHIKAIFLTDGCICFDASMIKRIA